MAVFSAIAGAIVTAIGISTATIVGTLTWAGLATSVIAGGLAYGTAKALGVFKPPKLQATKDPGVKIQLPPATDNKIPVFYGNIYTGGLIVDAGITNQNNTMIYVMVIGEKTDSGTYTVDKIFRDDQELVFSGATVTSVIDPNATSTNKVNGKMRCRVYAGNAQNSANQIFPTTGKVAAQTLLATIDATTSYEDLIYAVFELDYDPEENLVGLGAINFKITNSLSNPANVLLDYLQNDRYGAGLSNTQLELNSFTDMYDYCNAQVAYTTNANVSSTHSRWQIDGMLSTYNAVKDNIDEICLSSSTFFTYDPKQGKFKVVPNRAATAGEKANAFVFTDDNITSEIEFTSTELYSMYNIIEAEYPSYEKKDQTDVVLIETPVGDRNTNEPNNPLSTRFSLVNDRPRAYNLANIDLRQSRFTTVLQFEASYEAIQVDVGDVVKVTNSLYGYNEKLFRVMRVTEKETNEAMLAAEVILLEYADSVYEHNDITSDSAVNLSGIPGWNTGIWGNIDLSNIANIVNGNITVIDDPLSNIGNLVNPVTGNIVGNIDIGNIDLGLGSEGFGSGGGVIPSINVPITLPNIPGITQIIANLNPIGSSAGSNVANTMPATILPISPPGGNTSFAPGSNVNVTIPQPNLPLQDKSFSVGPLLPDILANLDLSFVNQNGQTSLRATAPNITLSNRGQIDRGVIGSVQAGLQVEEDVANVNSNVSSDVQDSSTANVQLGTANSLVTPIDVIDLGGIDEGEYSAINSAVPYGSFGANSILAYQPVREINYKEFDIATDGTYTANANADVTEVVGGSGILVFAGTTGIPSLNDNFKYEISRTRGSTVATTAGRPAASATKAYVANTMNIVNYANTNLIEDAPNNVFRGFDVTNADKRISKSDRYLGIGGFF